MHERSLKINLTIYPTVASGNSLKSFFKTLFIYVCISLYSTLIILTLPSCRELKENLVYPELQERPDWLVCLDPWDQLGNLDLPGLPDQVIVLDL